ncbi:hypothetical protein HK101_008519, partial [Irineochytrium annulatum]
MDRGRGRGRGRGIGGSRGGSRGSRSSDPFARGGGRRGGFRGRGGRVGGSGQFNRKKPDTTTTLPTSLTQLIEDHDGDRQRDAEVPSGKKKAVVRTEQELDFAAREERESARRFELRFDKKKTFGRKEERKGKRLEKKKMMNEYYLNKGRKDDAEGSTSAVAEGKVAGKPGKVANVKESKKRKADEPVVNGTKDVKKAKTVSADKPTSKPSANKLTESAKFARLAESNPGFYRLLVEKGLAPEHQRSDGTVIRKEERQDDE